MKKNRPSRKSNLGTFPISCWILALLAFVQLISLGLGISHRAQPVASAPEVVREFVFLPAARQNPVTIAPQAPQPKPTPPVADDFDPLADLPVPPPATAAELLNQAPPILDPVLEALLKDARRARIDGDLTLAHTKLSEAQLHEPNNPNVLYSLGSNYEAFGVFDKAAQYFLKVYQAGPVAAGSLYEKSAIKLAHGLVADVKGLARLGWGRTFPFERKFNGEKRTLLLPINVAPDRDFDPLLIEPKVRFYEEIDSQITQAIINEGDSGSEWVTGLADWQDGEEMAQVWYFVPDQDPATGLLFGERAFYGFVAELYYDGRLVDILAQPRTLLRSGGGQSAMEDLQRQFDELDGLSLEDLTAGDSLLPKIFGD